MPQPSTLDTHQYFSVMVANMEAFLDIAIHYERKNDLSSAFSNFAQALRCEAEALDVLDGCERIES
jgi:hypothetical protein